MSAFLVAIVLGLPEQQIIFFGILGACFSVVGHIFPVWLGFKGGKGIATSGGVMLALFPIWVFIAGLAIWLLLFFVTRYVSIASIAAALMLPTSSAVLTLFGMCDWYRTGIALILCILAIFKHKENIQRLLAGTEKRFEKEAENGRELVFFAQGVFPLHPISDVQKDQRNRSGRLGYGSGASFG